MVVVSPSYQKQPNHPPPCCHCHCCCACTALQVNCCTGPPAVAAPAASPLYLVLARPPFFFCPALPGLPACLLACWPVYQPKTNTVHRHSSFPPIHTSPIDHRNTHQAALRPLVLLSFQFRPSPLSPDPLLHVVFRLESVLSQSASCLSLNSALYAWIDYPCRCRTTLSTVPPRRPRTSTTTTTTRPATSTSWPPSMAANTSFTMPAFAPGPKRQIPVPFAGIPFTRCASTMA